MKINCDIITAQAIEFSADPKKYKPTNSLCFGYPQNFKPSKLNILTVYIHTNSNTYIDNRMYSYTQKSNLSNSGLDAANISL